MKTNTGEKSQEQHIPPSETEERGQWLAAPKVVWLPPSLPLSLPPLLPFFLLIYTVLQIPLGLGNISHIGVGLFLGPPSNHLPQLTCLQRKEKQVKKKIWASFRAGSAQGRLLKGIGGGRLGIRKVT